MFCKNQGGPWLPPLLALACFMIAFCLPSFSQVTQDIDDLIGFSSDVPQEVQAPVSEVTPLPSPIQNPPPTLPKSHQTSEACIRGPGD